MRGSWLVREGDRARPATARSDRSMLRGARSTEAPATIEREDILAHLAFLADAFTGAEGCPFVGETRAYLFAVTDAGHYLVRIDASAGGLGCTVEPVDDASHGPVDCTIACPPAELLAMLAGGAADIVASEPREMEAFLACFDFEGYASFCEQRHLCPWVPPTKSRRGVLGGRIARSLSTLGDAAQTAAKGAAAGVERGMAKCSRGGVSPPTSAVGVGGSAGAPGAPDAAASLTAPAAAVLEPATSSDAVPHRPVRLSGASQSLAAAADWLSRSSAQLAAAVVASGPVGLTDMADGPRGIAQGPRKSREELGRSRRSSSDLPGSSSAHAEMMHAVEAEQPRSMHSSSLTDSGGGVGGGVATAVMVPPEPAPMQDEHAVFFPPQQDDTLDDASDAAGSAHSPARRPSDVVLDMIVEPTY